MDDKLSIITNALECIRSFGWCMIGNKDKEANLLLKDILEQCGYNYKTHKHEISEQIFVSKKLS